MTPIQRHRAHVIDERHHIPPHVQKIRVKLSRNKYTALRCNLQRRGSGASSYITFNRDHQQSKRPNVFINIRYGHIRTTTDYRDQTKHTLPIHCALVNETAIHLRSTRVGLCCTPTNRSDSTEIVLNHNQFAWRYSMRQRSHR